MDIVFDMETGDPDDFMTLLLLLGHPRSNLKAVTVTPGTKEQISFVKWACAWLGKKIPVGAFDPDRDKRCVSAWHYTTYGWPPAAEPDGRGGEILASVCDKDTTLVTGAPLRNIGVAMDLGFKVGKWVAQGGFAGEGVVPPGRQLEKFRGMKVCPTYNLNGDPKSALRALEYDGIGHRRFVSKNICHGVVADRELIDRLGARKARHLELIHKGMETYLSGVARQEGREEAPRSAGGLLRADARHRRMGRGQVVPGEGTMGKRAVAWFRHLDHHRISSREVHGDPDGGLMYTKENLRFVLCNETLAMDGRWYISKPVELGSLFQIAHKRLWDAAMVLLGKAFAVEWR
jgi:inosine-uridine nucleoside N-ribohydrolase